MKKLAILAGLTLFGALPAAAQIDWIGNRVDANIFKNRLEHSQAQSRRNRQKKQKRTTKKTTPVMRRAPERYPQVQVNGQLLKTAVPATQIDGYTFVPFRDIFEALGATVEYNAPKRLVTATRGTSRMELLMPGGDSDDMKGTRQSFRSKEAPFKRNGVTMVPLRMVSEKMGAKVSYIQRRGTPLISIVDEEPRA